MAIVQAKVLEHPSSSGLQDELNAFLRTIDDDQLKDIKLSSHAVLQGDNIKESYTAIVIYIPKTTTITTNEDLNANNNKKESYKHVIRK
jgi:hypothetical protein